jgi:hypothetical protein
VQGVEKAFIELAKKVETVKGFEWGNNVSPEGKNDGFTHCFLVTFADKAGLDVYLPHPAHAEFVSILEADLSIRSASSITWRSKESLPHLVHELFHQVHGLDDQVRSRGVTATYKAFPGSTKGISGHDGHALFLQ